MRAVISTTTPKKVRLELAAWLRRVRIGMDWSQEVLAERSGVTLASLRRFETTGQVSLERLLRLALVLGVLDQFAKLAAPPVAFSSVAEVERLARKRATRRAKQP